MPSEPMTATRTTKHKLSRPAGAVSDRPHPAADRPLLRDAVDVISRCPPSYVRGAMDAARRSHFSGRDLLWCSPPLAEPTTLAEALAPFADDYLAALIDELIESDEYPPPPTYRLQA